MLSNLVINNFKIHKHTQLNIKNLTILTGMNGMGKSSIIQALLLLRQSLFDIEAGLNLKGDLCDMGVSGELACLVSNESQLTLNLTFSEQDSLKYIFEYPDNILDTLLPWVESNSVTLATLYQYSLFNENFQYLSAFRLGPQKSYNRDTSLVNSKKQISKVMGQCEYTVHYLDQYKNTEIPIKELAIPDKNDIGDEYTFLTQVERWLKMISPNIRISIEPQGEDYKLKYKFFREENVMTDNISALNTGFGITYVLPLLVAILSAKKDSLILIENPEAHIHPRGQAVLMELISRAAANGIQIILETHSDHIINGSLVAVHDKTLSKYQLSIYYFERDEANHTAISHELELSNTGKIRKPPQGFFDQISLDLKKLAGF